MYLWGAFPFVRFALALITGIVIAQFAPELWHPDQFIWATSAGFSTLIITSFFRGQEIFRTVQGFISCLLLAYIGGICVVLKTETNHPNHYSHFGKLRAFEVVLVSDATGRKDYYRFDAEVKRVVSDSGSFVASGTIHFYQRKSENNTDLHYGDVVLVKANVLPIPPPNNPHEFDYRQYLQHQQIYGHTFLSENDFKVVRNDPPSLVIRWGLEARATGLAIIQATIPGVREQAILGALILGVKDYLDNDLKTAYSSAGAMHVLAVSGLHVGIVFVLLGGVLGFLKKTKAGKVAFVLISLFSIWAYALITGFSPSVLRAVIMFSVILISGNLGKRAYIYNSLGIAALILLIYDPFLIYSVGFQLSFAAVFGIVYLHPRLYQLWEAPNRFWDYVWSITCVSVAAQVATFPLTMLYFHQFPTYFLVSNLLVIPAATAILMSGIFMLFVGSVWLQLGSLIGLGVGGLVWVVNECMMLLVRMPYSLFDWLYFDLTDTLLMYLVLIFLAVSLAIRGRTAFVMMLITVLGWAGWGFWKQREQSTRTELVIYEIKKHTAIDLIYGKEALLLLDTLDPAEMELIGFQINPNRLAGGLAPVLKTSLGLSESKLAHRFEGGYLVVWLGTRLLILDKPISEKQLVALAPEVVLTNADLRYSVPQKLVIGNHLPFYKQRKLKERSPHAHTLAMDGYFQMRLVD